MTSFQEKNEFLNFWKECAEQTVEQIEKIHKTQEISAENWVRERYSKDDARTMIEALENQIASLKTDSEFLFNSPEDARHSTAQTIDLLRRWILSGEMPSLLSFVVFSCDHWNIGLNQESISYRDAMICAAILGEIRNDLSYHDNMHYRKVLMHLIRLINVHNDIYAGTQRVLSPQACMKLMIAACIHDLGHDGLGNVVKGVFKQGKLEELSFNYAKPYLVACGLSEETLGEIKVLLMSTDVSPLNDETNLMSQMKAAYKYHFLGDKQRFNSINLDRPLSVLENNPYLTQMCLLLHEADIATSAGLSYAVTKYETTLFRDEIGKSDAAPEHVVDFLYFVCKRTMLSDAGQKLYAGNLARIYALAEEDFKNGNEKFPKAEYSEFLSALGSDNSRSVWQTIN